MNENNRSKHHILLIDDDDALLALLSLSLKKQGYAHIFTANNGMEGIEIIHKFKVDLVIIDWLMPGMNGLETFSKIKKEIQVDFPAIMLTGEDNTKLAIKFINMGGLNYLSKPVDIKHLDLDIIEAIVRHRKEMIQKEHDKELHFLKGVNQRRDLFIAEYQDEIYNIIHKILYFTEHCIKNKALENLIKIKENCLLLDNLFKGAFKNIDDA